MSRYIYLHRRGTTSDWAQATNKLHEGELGIEYSDDYSRARILIGRGSGYDALDFVVVNKIRTISLPSFAWVEAGSVWSQVVEIDGVTSKSKVDLQPNAEILAYLCDEEISLVAENNDGLVVVHALNGVPDRDLTLQATITEVTE